MEEKKLLPSLKKLIYCTIGLIAIYGEIFASDQSCPNELLYDKIQILDEADKEWGQTLQAQDFKEEDASAPVGYVFVSTSMPLNTLMQYELEAQKYGFHLLMQGLINENYRETIAFFDEFIQKTKGGITIDPELFQQFNVQQVPTIILTNGNHSDVIKGNITLEYALRSFATSGDLKEMARVILKEAS